MWRVATRDGNVTLIDGAGAAVEFLSESTAEQFVADNGLERTHAAVPAERARPTRAECIDQAARAYGGVLRELAEADGRERKAPAT